MVQKIRYKSNVGEALKLSIGQLRYLLNDGRFEPASYPCQIRQIKLAN